MHIRFRPLRMRVIFFFGKFVFVMCRRHVVTYKSCTTSQCCTIFKWQGFVNTIKKWKNGISVILTAKKPLLSIKMHIRFRPLRMGVIFFFAKFVFVMCRRHVVTYTSCTTSQRCIIFKWQGFVNTIKKWKNGISVILTAKKPLLSIKMHIRFRPLRMRVIFFFAKFVFVMCRRHVVTYTSCTTSQRCIIFKWQGFVNTIKKWKNGISVILTAKKPLLSIIMHIRFRPLRMRVIFFFAKFVFAICRRHVVTYTSCTTSQCCIIFKWQGFVNTI